MIMNKVQCLQAIIEKTAEVPVVFTTGYTCRDAYTIEDRDNHFYMVGSMGMASAIGLGLALDQEQPVVVVDGDGALLMNPSTLFLSVSLQLKNLIHIVLDNGSYESTGSQDTISPDFDFCQVAESIGYAKSVQAESIEQLGKLLQQSLQEQSGPTLLLCKINKLTTGPGDRISIPLPDIYRRFRTFSSAKTITK